MHIMETAWEVLFHPDFESEFDALPTAVANELLSHAKLVAHFGPHLARPRVDTLNASSYVNMKELRFDAASGVSRVAFAFDPKRRAIVLVAGGKAGVNQKRFYRQLVARADARFKDHLAAIKKRGSKP